MCVCVHLVAIRVFVVLISISTMGALCSIAQCRTRVPFLTDTLRVTWLSRGGQPLIWNYDYYVAFRFELFITSPPNLAENYWKRSGSLII